MILEIYKKLGFLYDSWNLSFVFDIVVFFIWIF